MACLYQISPGFFVHVRITYSIILKSRTEHGNDTVELCANFQNDRLNEHLATYVQIAVIFANFSLRQISNEYCNGPQVDDLIGLL